MKNASVQNVELNLMNEDLTKLISDTTKARSQIQLAAELQQNGLLFLLGQAVGTMLKILEHVEIQDKNIRFLWNEIESIKYKEKI